MRPRATIDSSPVSKKTGHMERHFPHFAHLSISVLKALLSMVIQKKGKTLVPPPLLQTLLY
jgi:hypothetical protein